jgi:hypothetical protein
MEGVLHGYVTNPNPTPTLTPNPNRNPNSNPNQINEKIQKETTFDIDQITKCQFGRWKLVKTLLNWQCTGATSHFPAKSWGRFTHFINVCCTHALNI